MSKTLDKLKANRPWITHIDDERSLGNSIIVTLATGYEFADDPGCGVQGYDTVVQVRAGTAKDNIVDAQ